MTTKSATPPPASSQEESSNIVQHLVCELMRQNGWSEMARVAEFMDESPVTVGRWKRGGWVSFEKLEEAIRRAGGDIWLSLPPSLRPPEHPGASERCELAGRIHAKSSFVMRPFKEPKSVPVEGLASLVDPAKWAQGEGPPVLFDTDGGAIAELPARPLTLVARAFGAGGDAELPSGDTLVVARSKKTTFLARGLQRVKFGREERIMAYAPIPSGAPDATAWKPGEIEVTHIICGAFMPL